MVRTGVVVLGHGSRSSEAKLTLERVASAIQNSRKGFTVRKACLQFDEQTLCRAVGDMVAQGIERIIVAPFFLYRGVHLREDIPREIEKAKEKYPHVEISLAEGIGDDPRVVEALLENLDFWTRAEWSFGSSAEAIQRKDFEFELPSEIEEESFRRIEAAVPLDHFDVYEREVAKRIIHASGDLALAERIAFAEDAALAGVEALRRGETILTDVMMVRSGVSARLAGELGVDVKCAISSEDTAEEAKRSGSTRCAAGMRLCAEGLNGGVIAVGNSPTALLEVCELVRKGDANPSLVIGMPVGFVGARESKELLLSIGVPAVTIRGTRGGSALAAAAVNAMLRLAISGQPANPD